MQLSLLLLILGVVTSGSYGRHGPHHRGRVCPKCGFPLERGPRPLFLRPISRDPEDSDSSSDEDDEGPPPRIFGRRDELESRPYVYHYPSSPQPPPPPSLHYPQRPSLPQPPLYYPSRPSLPQPPLYYPSRPSIPSPPPPPPPPPLPPPPPPTPPPSSYYPPRTPAPPQYHFRPPPYWFHSPPRPPPFSRPFNEPNTGLAPPTFSSALPVASPLPTLTQTPLLFGSAAPQVPLAPVPLFGSTASQPTFGTVPLFGSAVPQQSFGTPLFGASPVQVTAGVEETVVPDTVQIPVQRRIRKPVAFARPVASTAVASGGGGVSRCRPCCPTCRPMCTMIGCSPCC